MANHPGMREGGTPLRVFRLLADGKPRLLSEICRELEPENHLRIYNGAAQALLDMHAKRKVKRELKRGKYVYYRETATS